MKCISLWQPWATLVVLGAKKIETRHWYTPVRGRVAIHAAKRWTRDERDIAECRLFREHLRAWDRPLPLGAIVGTVSLETCVRITADNTPDTPERHFGNYEPGRYAWFLSEPVLFHEPIPTRGHQGWFDVELPPQEPPHA